MADKAAKDGIYSSQSKISPENFLHIQATGIYGRMARCMGYDSTPTNKLFQSNQYLEKKQTVYTIKPL